MTARRSLLAFAAFALLTPQAAPAADRLFSGTAATEVNMFIVGGIKQLEDDWKPADDQREFGVQMDFRPANWWANVALGFLYANSSKEDVEIPSGGTVTSESETAELNLGFRKYFRPEYKWRPFLGGGLALVRGEIDTEGPVSSTADSGMGAGFWVGGGTLYVMNWFAVGAQAQYTQADVKVFGQSLDAGGLHLDALVGIMF